MLSGASTPTATAWLPLGLRISHCVSLVPSFCWCSSWFRSRSDDELRSMVRIGSALPEVNGCGFRLPDTRAVNAGQADKGAVFGAERDVLIRLSHDRRLAGDRIAQ